MKSVYAVFFLGTVLLFAGCSGSQPGTPGEPVVSSSTPTTIATLVPTVTNTSVPIPSTSTPLKIEVSPTATPEKFALADKGYDIANVQLSYPSPSEVQITFQYRIHEMELAKAHAIGPLLPSSCTDARSSDYPTFFMVPRNSATGGGYYHYTVKSPGRCDLDSFYMVIYSPYDSGTWPTTDAIVYREEINQPLNVVRGLPAVNAKTLTVDNFAFEGTGSWSGVFTFGYSFSPELVDVIGKQHFVLVGSGMSGIAACDLSVSGPLITDLEGTYQIEVDLKRDLPAAGNGTDCRGRLDQAANLTYDQVWLSFTDNTYQQYIDFDITFKK